MVTIVGIFLIAIGVLFLSIGNRPVREIEKPAIRELPKEWDWPSGTMAMLARTGEEAEAASKFLINGGQEGIVVLAPAGQPGTVLHVKKGGGGKGVFLDSVRTGTLQELELIPDIPPWMVGNTRTKPRGEGK